MASAQPSPSTSTSATQSPALGARAKRWPAYLLTVYWPGLGHLYAGRWKRGCCWVALCGAALLFLSPGTLLVDGALAEPLVLSALRLEGTTFADVAFPLAVLVCSALDLYSLAALEAS